jgi:hypothetical protein
MFLEPDLIGRGYGRRLWSESLAVASGSHDRMLIMSDPGARGFYEAMGAVLEEEVAVAPDFSLGRYWYDLDAASGARGGRGRGRESAESGE